MKPAKKVKDGARLGKVHLGKDRRKVWVDSSATAEELQRLANAYESLTSGNDLPGPGRLLALFAVPDPGLYPLGWLMKSFLVSPRQVENQMPAIQEPTANRLGGPANLST